MVVVTVTNTFVATLAGAAPSEIAKTTSGTRNAVEFCPHLAEEASWARFAGFRHVRVRAVRYASLTSATTSKWHRCSCATATMRRCYGARLAAECRRGHGCRHGAFHSTQARVSTIGALKAISGTAPVIVLRRWALCAAQTIEEAPLGTRRARLPLVFELDAIAGVRRE